MQILAEDVGALALDLDRRQAIAETRDPGQQPFPANTKARPDPVLQVVRRRRPVRAEVVLDGACSGIVQLGETLPVRVVVKALEGGASVSRRAENQISLPGEWLEERDPVVREHRA